jgi:hypothetical protein
MPQASRTWIRTGDRRQPRIIGVPRTRQTAMPENAAAEPTATAQAQQQTAARNVRLPAWHHAERRGRSGRTHAEPPLCTATRAGATNSVSCAERPDLGDEEPG